MFLEAKSIWLIQGNFKKEQALEIVQMVNDLFKLDTKKKLQSHLLKVELLNYPKIKIIFIALKTLIRRKKIHHFLLYINVDNCSEKKNNILIWYTHFYRKNFMIH